MRLLYFVTACIVVLGLVPLSTSKVFADDPPASPPRAGDAWVRPPKTIVLDDVAPGTVLWTRVVPSTGAYPEDEPPVGEPPVVEPPPVTPPVPAEELPLEPLPPESIPAPPPPAVQAPRLVRAPVQAIDDCSAPCAQARDADCWPLDWCGNRYGCREITLEGIAATTQAPEGPFGLAVPGVPAQINYDGLDYAFAFGGRLTGRYWVTAQEVFEIRGTYYGGFDDSGRSAGVFGFSGILPGPPVAGVTAPNSTLLSAEADLYSAELNWWTELACEGCTRWDFVLGAKFVKFDELVTATNWASPIIPAGGPPSVQSDVENTFIGAQVGGAMHRDVGPRFTLTLAVKGMLGNMTREATVTDAHVFAGGAHLATSEDDELVYGVDADVGLRYRISPRIAVTAGYNFLWLDKVLRGHDAIDFTQSTSGALQAQQKTDQLIVHSFFLGVNFNF